MFLGDESSLSSANKQEDSLSVRLVNPDLDNQDVIMDEELQQSQTWTRGEKQPIFYRDLPFAVLFAVHLVAVLSIAFCWGIPALNYTNTSNSTETIHFSGIIYISLLSGLAALVLSTVALGIMAKYAAFLVQISVLFSVCSSLLVVIVMVLQGMVYGALMGVLFLALAACYAWAIWRRIPFAAANLTTALTAVRTNLGVSLVAYGMVLVAYVWMVLWTLAVMGVYVRSADCVNGVCENHMNAWVVILFLLSFCWTQQVIKNVLHVTIAGVVGTWWIAPADASSLWSRSIVDSLHRSVTTSFGSICLGSLLVAVIQVMRGLVEQARRNNNRDGILMCILECLLDLLEGAVAYFNKWAYIYVGIYGYSYLDAGKKVFTLFQERGWTTIINDDLVARVLLLVSFVVGGLTGCVGLALAAAHKSWVSEFPANEAVGAFFLTAFLIGGVICSVLMSVVASAVDAVIVCFAEVPFEFQTNHPVLNQQMVDAWRRVYPDEFNFC